EATRTLGGLLAHSGRDALLALLPTSFVAVLFLALDRVRRDVSLSSRKSRWSTSAAIGVLLPIVGSPMALVTATAASAAVTRTYYIAADDVVWDYAPAGQNLIAPAFDASF